MATIKDRINSSKGNQKKVLEAVFEAQVREAYLAGKEKSKANML